MDKKTMESDASLFLEELQKRVTVPIGEFEEFLKLWEPKIYKRNKFVLRAGSLLLNLDLK
jgi:DNA-binding Lrp family transcriptional regulator